MKVYPKSIGSKLPLMTIFTTRGCPNKCKFCSVTNFFGKKYRTKPISNVIEEIAVSGAEKYFFVDDNIACDPDYSRELFLPLIAKKIRWVSQISTTVLKYPHLIELDVLSYAAQLFDM